MVDPPAAAKQFVLLSVMCRFAWRGPSTVGSRPLDPGAAS